LGVPHGKLKLSDRFLYELSPHPKWSLYNTAAEVHEDIIALAKKAGIDQEIGNVQEYLDLCVRLLDRGCDRRQLLRKIL
jgi:hypothetical protein